MLSKSKSNRGNKKLSPRTTEMSSCASYTILKDEPSDDEQPKRTLKVHIYESEKTKIKKWVLQYRNIETGGDLFGLWVDSHTAVVQFALGPGENCSRYDTAFFQDLKYLENAGSYLTKLHGLCNIGQWHSHHQLSLSQPSAGDENTVWSHMPTLGLTRYIVCIANISRRRSAYNASVNCFLFELDQGVKLPVLQGTFKRLKQRSPVTEHSDIMREIEVGAEKEREPTPRESCWSRWWSKLKQCLCLDSSKYQAILAIGLIAAPFVILIIVLSTIYNNVPKY